MIIASSIGLALGIAVGLVGAVLAAFAFYLLILAIAAFFYRSIGRGETPTTRVAVVVPAHDEEPTISRCIASLRAQRYPDDLYEIVVVADNCSDRTAEIAQRAGARVLVRTEPGLRGKGRALQWAFERLLAGLDPPDAVVIVDADCTADPDLVGALVAVFEAGAEAVQGVSRLVDDRGTRTALRGAAFLLINSVRPAGRAVLGLPCSLSGTGMLLGRELLLAHPWSAFSCVEDNEYTMLIRHAGVRPQFAREAVVWSRAAPNRQAAAQQQLRWEGGKLYVARTMIPALLVRAVRKRQPNLVEAAIGLAVPPLGYLAAVSTMVTAASVFLWAAGLLASWAVVLTAAALAAIPVYVLVGLRAAEAPRSAYRALLAAPAFVVAKPFGARRLIRFRADSWVRTERAGEQGDPG